MDSKEKSISELFEELKANGAFESGSQINQTNDFWWIFALMTIFIWFAPQDKSKESYLQGKVDAYEKIIRRMF